MHPSPLPEVALPSGYGVQRASVDDASFLARCRTEMLRELDGESADTGEPVVSLLTAWAAEQIRRETLVGWIATCDAEPVGGVMAVSYNMLPMATSPDGRVGRLVGMYVAPGHRRRGLARALVASALHGFHGDGIRVVRLGASEAGARVYEDLGFEPFPEMGILLPEREG